ASRHTWDLAVTTTFFAGLAIFLLSVSNLTEKLIALLPPVLKSAILVGIGLYQAFVGLRTMNIIESDPTELLRFVSTMNWDDTSSSTGTVAQVLFGVTLFLTAAMYVLEVNGAILIGISTTTIICWSFSLGGVKFPGTPVQVPLFGETFWNFAFEDFFSGAQWIGTCLSFVLITLFDVAGIMFGVMTLVHQLLKASMQQATTTVGHHANIAADEDEEDIDQEEVFHGAGLDGGPREDESMLSHHAEIIAPWEARRAIMVVGISTMASAVLGCSPCIIFLECIAGVASGSRTGFSSVMTALFFALSLPFVPLFRSVPACASSPALVIIGCFMMSSASEIPWHDHKLAMPAFLTISMMPFTASITPGIVIGIASFAILHAVDWLAKKYRVWRGIPIRISHGS
ncbi:xanthine/uracil permease, putative, partial [Bodo saltans]